MAGADVAFGRLGQQRLTSLSSPVTLTVPSGTTHVWLQAETNDVRIRFSGGTPNATDGVVIRADDPPIELPVDLIISRGFTAQVIEETASAQLNVTYFGHS